MDVNSDTENSRQSVRISIHTISESSTEDERSAKTSKSTYGFMERRTKYKVIVDYLDVTPDNIIDMDYVMMDDSYSHAAFESKARQRSEGVLKSVKSADVGIKVYATTISLDDIHIDHTFNTEEGIIADTDCLDIAPSAFYLPKAKPVMSYPPDFFLILKETETTFLFELPCFSCEKGSLEAASVEQENEFYQYITVGKGRNRKMVNEETQTKECITQTRHTLATRPQKKNAYAFASMWDMHDTYAQLAKKVVKEEEDEMVMYQSAASSLLRKKKPVKIDPHARGDGLTFDELTKTPRFLDAVLLVERVLASLKYCDQQKDFRGLIQMDPLALDLKYIYTLKPLWTFECDETIDRPISCISFNPKNENILAVGHGKYGYADVTNGLVCIWCTKNPCKPERIYRFDDPLTSLSFSESNPNWLACGFCNGDVLILDIISYETKIIAKSKRDTNPCFEPIWTTSWRKRENSDIENVITTCQDGRINRFTNTKTHDFICTPMMRITTVEGKIKGLDVPKSCPPVDVPITRYPAALCTKSHPKIEHIYYVGTDEGCIHKCSTHYLNQHMDVFRAHAGPVYDIQLSPFMKHLMVTCGADNAVRLWLDGVDDVIMTLSCNAAVYGVAFSPINATILITASGNAVSVWDLRRKTHIPCAEYTFSNYTVLTYVRFSASGDNVIVGDSTGRIHTFHLEDTPIAPFNQRKMLDDAIKRALCTRPQLLKQIEKLEKFRQKRS